MERMLLTNSDVSRYRQLHKINQREFLVIVSKILFSRCTNSIRHSGHHPPTAHSGRCCVALQTVSGVGACPTTLRTGNSLVLKVYFFIPFWWRG